MKHIKDDKREHIRLEKILAKMKKGPHVAVGILQDEKVSDGFTMVDLATIHEYGSKDGHIPSRSFMRSTCDSKRQDHLKLIAKLQTKIIEGKMTIRQALTQLGEAVSKDMVQTINRGLSPSLKPATTRRKKSSTPLIDSGRLKGSIQPEVRGAA